MAMLRKLVWITLWLGVGAGSLHAATGEKGAFSAAAKAYQDQTWWFADELFGQFVDKFPKSELRPQAVLYQAIARYWQTNSAGTIELLRTNLDRAGALADEYQFWIAEAFFQKADFTNAAEAYVELNRRYLTSRRRLEAFVGEAACRSRLNDWTAVVARLGAPEGEFARSAQAALTNVFAVRGYLLLGEAQLALKNHAGVEQAVAPLKGQNLAGDLAWRAERLSYEAQFASARYAEALVASSNLVALAGGQKRLLAESVARQAAVLEKLGRLEQARSVYELNLTAGTSGDRQRQALLKLTELALAQGNVGEATNQLTKFLNLASNEPAADLALLALGEIHLRQYAAVASTNQSAAIGDLDQAAGLFDRLITTFTNSEYFGKAELDRGWCFWLRTNQVAESAGAFASAAAWLAQRQPDSEDRFDAHVKLGDALFLLKDYARALTNYQQAAALLTRWPKLHEALAGDVYLLWLRASIEVNDDANADEAVNQILKLTPRENLADRARILRIQALDGAGDTNRTRVELEKFVAKLPESPQRPVVELVIGAARERQGAWVEAIAGYEQWLARFPTNELRSRAEFQLAWSHWRAGHESNAYSGFTNFVVVYATNELAPQAQWWLADHFWRQGKYTEAEIKYKDLIAKWPDSDLAYPARLKAGQAALQELRYDEARSHFTNLTSDVKCPPEIWSQAVFAYGDMLMVQPAPETNRLANFEEAIRVFGQIPQRFIATSNVIAVLALGESAKCWRQMGRSGWTNALTAFSQVATSPVVSLSARSEAQVGLAGLLSDMAQAATGEEQVQLLREALRNLLEVVYQKNLRDERESGDAFWIKKAGLDAGPLLEKLGDWEAAEKLYLRMQALVPPERARFQRKIEQLRERKQAAENNSPRI